MHCQHEESCRAAVGAGVDTLEHGQHLPVELIDEMVRRGTVWGPTRAVFQASLPQLRAAKRTERRDRYIAGAEAMGPNAAAAARAGMRLLAGTDSRPTGRVVDEVRAQVAAGVPVEAALAGASWAARQYLGLPGLADGAPADAVVYDTDPRADPGVLEHPARVILRGRVLR
jgi:imidazolonepropionase-like amidohydrolase